MDTQVQRYYTTTYAYFDKLHNCNQLVDNYVAELEKYVETAYGNQASAYLKSLQDFDAVLKTKDNSEITDKFISELCGETKILNPTRVTNPFDKYIHLLTLFKTSTLYIVLYPDRKPYFDRFQNNIKICIMNDTFVHSLLMEAKYTKYIKESESGQITEDNRMKYCIIGGLALLAIVCGIRYYNSKYSK